MKKAIFILGAIAVAAACSQEKEMPLVKSMFTIRAEAADEPLSATTPSTKVSYSEGPNANGNSGIHWEADDKIALVPSEGQQIESTGTQRADDGKTAEFTVSATEGTYTVYHPYHAESTNGAICFNIPATQSQNSAGFMDAGAKRLPLIGQAPVELSANTSFADVKFNVIGTLLRFFVYGGAEGEQLKKVGVSSAEATLSGKITTSNAGAISSEVAGGGNAVTVTLGNAESIPSLAEDAKGVYAVVVPATIAGNAEGSVTYTVTTNKYTYTFSSKDAHTWESGKKYDIYLNLAKKTGLGYSPIDAPNDLYILGDATTAGWTPKDAIKMNKNGDVFSLDLLLYDDKAFHFANHNKEGDYTNAYVKDVNTGKLEYTGNTSAGNNNFKIEEGTGWYTLTVDFGDGSVKAVRHRPSIRKLGKLVEGYNQNDQIMENVEGQPGVFYKKEKFSSKNCEGFDFQFIVNTNDSKGYNYFPTGERPAVYSKFSDKNGVTVGIQQGLGEGDGYRWWFAPTDLGIDYEITIDTKNMVVKVEAAPEFYLLGNVFTAIWDSAFDHKIPFTRVAGQRKAEYTGNVGSKAGTGSDWKICSKYVDGWGWYKGLWLFASEYQDGGVPIYPKTNPDAVYGVSKSIYSGGGDVENSDKKWRFGSEAADQNVKVTLDWSDWNNITLKCVTVTE